MSALNHYVYGLEDPKTNQFYFGSRSCECKPEEDNYKGSMVAWTPENKDRLIKYILYKDLKSREEAILIEASFQKTYVKHNLNENYCIAPKNFHGIGRKKSKEEIEKIRQARIRQGCTMSKETRKKMGAKLSKMFKGKKKSKESILKRIKTIKENNTFVGKNNPMYGKKHSKETRDKIRKNSISPTKGKFGKKHPSSKKIIQINLEGSVIKIWESMSDIERNLGFNQGNISNACYHRYGRNNTNKAYGFIWKFEGE